MKKSVFKKSFKKKNKRHMFFFFFLFTSFYCFNFVKLQLEMSKLLENEMEKENEPLNMK